LVANFLGISKSSTQTHPKPYAYSKLAVDEYCKDACCCNTSNFNAACALVASPVAAAIALLQ
jgi:hypothetical protein